MYCLHNLHTLNIDEVMYYLYSLHTLSIWHGDCSAICLTNINRVTCLYNLHTLNIDTVMCFLYNLRALGIETGMPLEMVSSTACRCNHCWHADSSCAAQEITINPHLSGSAVSSPIKQQVSWCLSLNAGTRIKGHFCSLIFMYWHKICISPISAVS